jgi:hypothetical protein
MNPQRPYLALAGALLLAALLAFSHFTAYRSGRHSVQAKWDEANVKQERAAQQQAASNRELQRLAEAHFHAIADPREAFIKRTAKELRHATETLAAVPVPADAVRMLNAAAACARGDSAAACGAGDQVPDARQPGR